MFKTRCISAVFLVIIALVTILSGSYILAATLLAISCIAFYELSKACNLHTEKGINILEAVCYLAILAFYAFTVFASDDMLIIRGVNVFPSQVEAALLEMGETAPYYMMIVDRVNNLDTLEVQVEVDEVFFSDKIGELESLTKKIAHVIQQAIGLAVKVKLVEPKTIERSMGKAVRVIDKRKLI